MNAEEMMALGREAIVRFNDPGRRDEYFEVLYEDDVVLHGYTPEPLTPKPAVRAFYADLFTAFPDARVESDEMFVARDRLVWRFRFMGTHDGPFMGAEPTGREFEIAGITILRFGERRCVERWSSADFLGMMAQLGLFPGPG
jgi:predicted ester cyclase